jgi:hypothetical protein
MADLRQIHSVCNRLLLRILSNLQAFYFCLLCLVSRPFNLTWSHQHPRASAYETWQAKTDNE